MTWVPMTMVVDMRQGQLYHALIALRDDAGQGAAVHLNPKTGGRVEGAEPTLALVLAAAGYATGVALRREAREPQGVKLLVDGREQQSLTRYGDVLQRVADLADAYADTL